MLKFNNIKTTNTQIKSLILNYFSPFIIFLLTFFPGNSKSQNIEMPAEFLISNDEIFKKELSKHLIPLSLWIEKMNSLNFELLCLGESHYPHFRTFYKDHIFSAMKFDQIALEEDSSGVENLLKNFDSSSEINLLGADIKGVLVAAKNSNPILKIFGIEPSKSEMNLIYSEKLPQNLKGRLSRDGFIARNLRSGMQKKTIALYGALHCGSLSIGLGNSIPFFHMLMKTHKKKEKKYFSAQTIFPNGQNILRIYIDMYNLAEENMVLMNGAEIPTSAFNERADIANELKNYDAIILPFKKKETDTNER